MVEYSETGNMWTVREVARKLHVHPSTLRRWSNAERIKVYRITPRGDRRYRREDVARFLAEMNTPKDDGEEARPPRR